MKTRIKCIMRFLWAVLCKIFFILYKEERKVSVSEIIALGNMGYTKEEIDKLLAADNVNTSESEADGAAAESEENPTSKVVTDLMKQMEQVKAALGDVTETIASTAARSTVTKTSTQSETTEDILAKLVAGTPENEAK